MADKLGFTDPTAGAGKPKVAMAPRPVDLAGKVVGLLDNGKEQSDVILQTLGDALCERYGAARVIIRRTESYTRPAAEDLLDDMAKEVQVAIAALGG